MNIPMFITITKPNIPKYETITFVCNTLDECQNKLIVNLKNIIYRQIDYPADVDDFVTNYWYNENSMDNEFFDYQLFIDNKWTKPWTLQELYEIVINIINQVDIQNSIYNDKNYYDYCSESDEEEKN
jgi:hypothetical protein